LLGASTAEIGPELLVLVLLAPLGCVRFLLELFVELVSQIAEAHPAVPTQASGSICLALLKASESFLILLSLLLDLLKFFLASLIDPGKRALNLARCTNLALVKGDIYFHHRRFGLDSRL